jgi:adenylylsulfate kinase
MADAPDHKLYEQGIHSAVLDGDNVRHTLNARKN